MFKTVQFLFLLYPQSPHPPQNTETVPPHHGLHSIHMEGFGFDKIAHYRDKLLLHTCLHPSVQDVPGWGSPQKLLLLSPLTLVFHVCDLLDIGGRGRGKSGKYQNYQPRFSISKLFLLHMCNSNVFILLHEIIIFMFKMKGKA